MACYREKVSVDIIDGNLHIKGSLLVDGKIGSRSQNAVVVISQQDLCFDVLSSFVPILIPEQSLVEELNLNLPHFYNRHLQILNLTRHEIRLIIPTIATFRTIQLASQHHVNITIFADRCLNLLSTVFNTPTPSGDRPTLAECVGSFDLPIGQTLLEAGEILAGRLDFVFNEGPGRPFTSTFLTTRGTLTLVTQQFPIGENTRTIGITTLVYDANTAKVLYNGVGQDFYCGVLNSVVHSTP